MTTQQSIALKLAEALLENVDALLRDASTLQEAGSVRSVALAIMALEEIGKVHLCLDAITDNTPLPASRSREWRDHRDKLETSKALELGFLDADPDFEGGQAEVERLLTLKMSSLYVDREGDSIHRPADIQVDAVPLISRGYAQAGVLRPLIARITPEALGAMQVHRTQVQALLEAIFDESDPAGSAKRLRPFVDPELLGDPAALESAVCQALKWRSPTGRGDRDHGSGVGDS